MSYWGARISVDPREIRRGFRYRRICELFPSSPTIGPHRMKSLVRVEDFGKVRQLLKCMTGRSRRR